MKKIVRTPNYICAMALINPPLTLKTSILVEVLQGNEGPIPHVHVFHDKTRNPNKCSIIRLDKPEYSTHHKPNIRMPRKVKDEFIQIMTSPWPKHIIQVSDGVYRPATGYEAAVDIWVDTHENGSYDKFDLDENGNVINLDYNNL